MEGREGIEKRKKREFKEQKVQVMAIYSIVTSKLVHTYSFKLLKNSDFFFLIMKILFTNNLLSPCVAKPNSECSDFQTNLCNCNSMIYLDTVDCEVATNCKQSQISSVIQCVNKIFSVLPLGVFNAAIMLTLPLVSETQLTNCLIHLIH